MDPLCLVDNLSQIRLDGGKEVRERKRDKVDGSGEVNILHGLGKHSKKGGEQSNETKTTEGFHAKGCAAPNAISERSLTASCTRSISF